jgi:hypothetical protein
MLWLPAERESRTFHVQRIHCCLPGSLPATLQQGKAIAAMHPDVETSRRSRRGPGQNSALLASIVVPAGARTAPQVQPVSRPDSIKPTVTQDPTALDKATNTLYTAGMRGRDPKTNKPVEGTFRVSASQ